jgi:hypothetical protein
MGRAVMKNSSILKFYRVIKIMLPKFVTDKTGLLGIKITLYLLSLLTDKASHVPTNTPKFLRRDGILPVRKWGKILYLDVIEARLVSIVILLFGGGLLTACLPTSTLSITPTPIPRTAWGEIQTLGQASYAPAPNMVVDNGDVLMSWVGEDEERVFQALKRWRNGQLDETVIPVLDSLSPFEQRIFPADQGGFHLLWMDTDFDTEQIQLFSAYLDNTLTTIIAPDSISDQQVTHYTAINDVNGALWVVWSGGLLAEPSLQLVRIDGLGRPLFPERLTLDGDYPVFAKTLDNQIYLFWTSRVNQRLMRAGFIDGDLRNIRAVSRLPDRALSDRLAEFSVMFDRTHQYLFWNITRDDGRAETYISTSPINSDDVSIPQPLTISVDNSRTIQTGFNSGIVSTAVSAGSTVLSWARPLNESADILPIAVQNDESIGVVYMQGGAIIGYQSLTETGRLLGSPQITTDRDRHLYVTWSEPTSYGVADLNFTTTR